MAKRKPKPKARPGASIPPGTPIVLQASQIAAALAISIRSFWSLVAAREFPEADIHIGRLPRWKSETLAKWIEARCKNGRRVQA